MTNVIEQLREYGETRRGWLGVRIQDVTEDVAEAMGLDEAKGALVTDVPEGPAPRRHGAGRRDRRLRGRRGQRTRELVRRVGNAEVGKSVRVTVYRDGATRT